MTQTIKTIDDLLWAQENDPKLVDDCFKEVTVIPDLERYLKWLHTSQATISVVSQLKRTQQRALGIHPSSAAKKAACLLKLYYECTGELKPERSYDQKSQQTWDIGTLLHDLHQAHFREMYGDQFADEVSLVDDELHVHSSTDGIFDFTRIRIILEVKSIKEGGNFGWAKVQAAPMEDNVRQAYFYMKLANVPFGILFYVCKNNGEFKEHPIMFDPAVWDEIKTTVVDPVVSAAYNNGPKVVGNTGWHCRQCSFYRSCPKVKEEESYAKGSGRSWKRS